MKIMTNTNQLKIIQSVSTPKLLKTINPHINDDHLFYQITMVVCVLDIS